MTAGRTLLTVVFTVVLAGCVTNPTGPVRDASAYAAKAERTVADARSAVGTTALAVDGELTGRSFRAYAGQLVDDAVATLVTAQDTFESIVPPDDASGALRTRVLDAVATARRALVDVRAALATDDEAVRTAAEALSPAADALDALDQELGG
jgi:hypothetical protein